MKLRSYKIILALLALALCGLPASRVLAQGLTLDIINGVPSAIPITVVPFASRAPRNRRPPMWPR